MNRRFAFTGPVLLALVAAVSAQKKEEPGAVYKKPEEAFDAAKKAAGKGDYKAFYKVLTPASGELLTAQVALLCVAMKNAAAVDKGQGNLSKQLKPVFAVMEKHGLKGDVVKKLKPLGPKADAKEQEKLFKEAIKPIKDPAQFIHDALTKMQEAYPKGSGGLKEIANDKLEDVKVDGDKATGTAVGLRKGKDKPVEAKTPLKFEKIQGSWRIVLPKPAKKEGG